MSIKILSSGMSISFICIIADVTSLLEIPAYLSFASFKILFCTIVTYLPGIVTYAECIFKFAISSTSEIVFEIALEISSSSVIFDFFIPKHLHSLVAIISTWLKLFTSPTTTFTLEVPKSMPTIISPIAKTNSSIYYVYLNCYKNIIFS